MPVPGNSAAHVQPLERSEELARVGHVEPRAVVANEVRGCPSFDVTPTSMRALGRWLVNFQALPRRFSMTAPAGGRRPRPPAFLHDDSTSRSGRLPKSLPDRAGDAREIDPFSTQLGAAHAREREQIVDQVGHSLRGGAHASEVALPLRVELVGVVFEDGLTEAVDAPQGRRRSWATE
jgi:hypothetical protein